MKIKGVVVSGLGYGRKLGWPTANIRYATDAPLPGKGVYAGWANVDGARYPAAIVIGAREETPPLLEAHLIGFAGELLNKIVELTVFELVSALELIQNEEQLKLKIADDVEKVKNALHILK